MKTQKQFTKQVLSIFLCIAMLLSLIPPTVFATETDEKVQGTSTISNGTYLKGNITAQEALFNATRTDFRDESVYTLMISRFNDGDSSNNVHCWDDGQAGNPDTDPAWHGDFKGLIEKLDYIKALGFTAIRLNPVAQNASGYDYHGYHPVNLKEIDFRYESNGYTYQDVIDACHAKGLKVMQEVVINSTSNFGEENLRKIFELNPDADWSSITEALVPTDMLLEKYPNYTNLPVSDQFRARMDLLKESLNSDEIYHRETNMNYNNYLSQQSNIAGDCMDLNTENPVVALYLAESCFAYAAMGVDAIMISNAKYVNRWTLNEGILPFLRNMLEAADLELEIFYELQSRYGNVWYYNIPSASVPFYSWKETESEWQNNWDSTSATANIQTSIDHFNAHSTLGDVPTSNNAMLNGITYHTPDYSESSGMHPYDFSMMWSFQNANIAFKIGVAEDRYMNDSTWNLTSVDTWDYGPDSMQTTRYSLGPQAWAENLNLMFTFRGIPSILYGTEIEFQKNMPLNAGPNVPLSQTGRAYYGDKMMGSVTSDKFLNFTAYGEAGASLSSPLATHIRQLNALRMSIPALRKGQYTTNSNYVNGNMAYIRRYTNETEGIDSLALVTLSGGATFKNIPNGKYIDAVTGNVQNVTNGTLEVDSIDTGDMRIYVCCADGFTGLDVSEMSAASRTLRFSANGGTGTINSISIKGNEKATLPECTFTAPADSTFLGWNVNGTMYQPGDEVEFSVNSLARAVWNTSHTHAFTYTVLDNTITATCTAEGCDNTNGGSVSLNVNDAYYTGYSIGATVTGNFTNGATYKVTYNGAETAPSDVGTYTANLTVYEYGIATQSVTAEYKISYLPAPTPAYAISGHSYYDEINDAYWFKSGDIVTVNAPQEYAVSAALNDTYGGSVSFYENDVKIIYLKRLSDNALTDVIEVVRVHFDANSPTGEIIVENRGFWEKLISKITFGLFFKGDTVATVAAQDTESGVESIEYYIANEDLIGDDTLDQAVAISGLEAAVNDGWVTYDNEIALNNNAENVIYVKITDNVGNVTYISSDGIVLDSIAPELFGIEDGGIYYGDKIFKATDDNFLSIEVDGRDITDTTEGDDEFKIIADNAEHTVTVTDKAGNVTEYTITVYKKYIVTYTNGEGGSYEKEFKYGEIVTIPTNEIFEETFRKPGHTIKEWQGYTEGMTMPLENLTFTAIYTPNQYAVQFDTNGGEAIAPITVTFGEKYGNLPSSAIAGLSGGDSNWYLVDANGVVTDTKITKLSVVSQTRNHTLFVKRKVLAPTVNIALTVPGGLSNSYQYYIPGASERVLTATVGNINTDILNYTYQWYKNGTSIEGATSNVLTLDGNVSDSGTYKVEVTATLKDGTNIVVTSNSAISSKEQNVKILHATNTLRYDANGGEGGPQNAFSGGTSLNVSKDAPTREHYDFIGWNTAVDGSGDSYAAEDAYTFANDGGNGGCVVTLYAQWKLKEYTVTYMADGETVSTEKVEYGKDATLPAVPHKDGCVGKWDSDGKNITGDTTISAIYKAIPALKPDEVKPEDKADLEDAKANLEEELKDDSYTEDYKKDIQNAIDDIENALEVIGNVEKVEDLIAKLPDTVTKDDEAAIKAADDALGALTEYEKSLVGEDAKKALEDAKTALAELNKALDTDKPADTDKPTDTDRPVDTDKPTDTDNSTDSPQTGDNSNLWLWFALLFASGAGVFAITLNDRKKAENK